MQSRKSSWESNMDPVFEESGERRRCSDASKASQQHSRGKRDSPMTYAEQAAMVRRLSTPLSRKVTYPRKESITSESVSDDLRATSMTDNQITTNIVTVLYGGDKMPLTTSPHSSGTSHKTQGEKNHVLKSAHAKRHGHGTRRTLDDDSDTESKLVEAGAFLQPSKELIITAIPEDRAFRTPDRRWPQTVGYAQVIKKQGELKKVGPIKSDELDTDIASILDPQFWEDDNWLEDYEQDAAASFPSKYRRYSEENKQDTTGESESTVSLRTDNSVSESASISTKAQSRLIPWETVKFLDVVAPLVELVRGKMTKHTNKPEEEIETLITGSPLNVIATVNQYEDAIVKATQRRKETSRLSGHEPEDICFFGSNIQKATIKADRSKKQAKTASAAQAQWRAHARAELMGRLSAKNSENISDVSIELVESQESGTSEQHKRSRTPAHSMSDSSEFTHISREESEITGLDYSQLSDSSEGDDDTYNDYGINTRLSSMMMYTKKPRSHLPLEIKTMKMPTPIRTSSKNSQPAWRTSTKPFRHYELQGQKKKPLYASQNLETLTEQGPEIEFNSKTPLCNIKKLQTPTNETPQRQSHINNTSKSRLNYRQLAGSTTHNLQVHESSDHRHIPNPVIIEFKEYKKYERFKPPSTTKRKSIPASYSFSDHYKHARH